MTSRLAVVALLLPAALLAGCGLVPASPAAGPGADSPVPGSVSAAVARVVDGDTVHVRTSDGHDLDVRVVGENSPEVVDPHGPVQCFGVQASAEAHRVLDGQPVTVRRDPTQAPVDRYGRTLRYVTLPSGEDLSMHMVAGGWARAYKVKGPAPQQWSQLVAAQHQARAAGRGLWAPRPQGCAGGL